MKPWHARSIARGGGHLLEVRYRVWGACIQRVATHSVARNFRITAGDHGMARSYVGGAIGVT